jgi:hypothetical protein
MGFKENQKNCLAEMLIYLKNNVKKSSSNKFYKQKQKTCLWMIWKDLKFCRPFFVPAEFPQKTWYFITHVVFHALRKFRHFTIS